MRKTLALTPVAALWLMSMAAAAATPEVRLDQWLDRLGDPEPAVRAAAREHLMGLRPLDLPALVAAVAVAPRRPAVDAGLREVVTYVIAHAVIRQVPDQGEAMLGVTLTPGGDRPGFGGVDTAGEGVSVMERLAGFVGYRYLQTGDVILGFGLGPWFEATPDRPRVQAYVARQRPGDTVFVRVRRVDRVLTLVVPLDHRPRTGPRPLPGAPALPGDEAELRNLIKDAVDAANEAFRQQFGAVTGDDLG